MSFNTQHKISLQVAVKQKETKARQVFQSYQCTHERCDFFQKLSLLKKKKQTIVLKILHFTVT